MTLSRTPRSTTRRRPSSRQQHLPRRQPARSSVAPACGSATLSPSRASMAPSVSASLLSLTGPSGTKSSSRARKSPSVCATGTCGSSRAREQLARLARAPSTTRTRSAERTHAPASPPARPPARQQASPPACPHARTPARPPAHTHARTPARPLARPHTRTPTRHPHARNHDRMHDCTLARAQARARNAHTPPSISQSPASSELCAAAARRRRSRRGPPLEVQDQVLERRLVWREPKPLPRSPRPTGSSHPCCAGQGRSSVLLPYSAALFPSLPAIS